MIETFRIVFQAINAILLLYMILLFIRIFTSWFSLGSREPAFFSLLGKICDPYLNFFRPLKFLRYKNFDLTPLAAIIVLQLLLQLTQALAQAHRISVGFFLALFVLLVGESAKTLAFIAAILAGVRLVSILLKASAVSQLWYTLDHLLQPMIYPLLTRLSRNRVVPYGTGLIVFLLLCLGLWFLLDFLTGRLAGFLYQLPF